MLCGGEEAGACGVVWCGAIGSVTELYFFYTAVGGMEYRVGIWNKKTDCRRRLRH